MIDRRIGAVLTERLDTTPAVALLGPRQVNKTTLARVIGEQCPISSARFHAAPKRELPKENAVIIELCARCNESLPPAAWPARIFW